MGFISYDIYRFDRSSVSSDKLRGGGVLIAARKSLRSSPVETSLNSIEHVFIKFRLINGLCILGCFYVPPNSSLSVFFWSEYYYRGGTQ